MSEEEILAATVGERLPLNDTIHLSPHDLAWPSMFLRLKGRIQDALGDRIRLLEHVGSTSVPGLSAKPIIDMVLAVDDSSDESQFVGRLEETGFTLRIREPDWHQHRLLKSKEPKGNLHVFSAGSEEIGRMLTFRDWLREHDEDRIRYEETKRELAGRTWKYTQNYADAKSKIIQEIMVRARGT
ncbi:MAG: GrpB family protein [Anaerolineales bacterium]